MGAAWTDQAAFCLQYVDATRESHGQTAPAARLGSLPDQPLLPPAVPPKSRQEGAAADSPAQQPAREQQAAVLAAPQQEQGSQLSLPLQQRAGGSPDNGTSLAAAQAHQRQRRMQQLTSTWERVRADDEVR